MPRKSSTMPTMTAIVAPSSSPRVSWPTCRNASAGTSIPKKSAIPPRRGTGSWFTRLPPGTSTTPSRRAIPPTAGVSMTTMPNATSAPQRTSRWSPSWSRTLRCGLFAASTPSGYFAAGTPSPAASVVPADGDLSLDPRQRERLRLRLDSVALRAREPAPRVDAQVCLGSPPGSDDLPGDEHGARPDAGGPQLGAELRIGDEQLATGAPVEVVRVAAWQEARRGRWPRRLAEAGFVPGEDPGVADRRSHRGERGAQGIERRAGSRVCHARPGRESGRCCRPEHVQVPASQLPPRLLWLDLGRRHRPDVRCPRAVPAQKQRAGRCRVLDRVADPECLLHVVVLQPPAREVSVHARGHVFGSRAPTPVVGQPAEGEDRTVARGHDIHAAARPPHLDERRILPARRLCPLHPRVDREESRPRDAVRQSRQGRASQGARASRE